LEHKKRGRILRLIVEKNVGGKMWGKNVEKIEDFVETQNV
jgi:hypothetical protein